MPLALSLGLHSRISACREQGSDLMKVDNDGRSKQRFIKRRWCRAMGAMDDMDDLRVIKRYANRKMYDTGTSKYITLDEIALLVDDGIDLKIIDNDTKDDLTEVTLAQILVERSRRGKLEHSVTSLRGMIKNTGEQFTKKISEPVTQLKTSVEESMNRLIRTGEERAAGTRDQVQGWIDQNTQAIEEIQRKVDERIRITAGRFDIMSTMKTQLEVLEARVAELEKKLQDKS